MNDRDLQVLEQYPFTVRGSFRVRGAFLLDTSEGRRLIREYSGSVQKLETEQKLLLHLQEQGYLVESRRGGGGYIRIFRMAQDTSEHLLYLLHQRVGDSIDALAASHLVQQLQEREVVTKGEAAMMNAALSPQALSLPLSAEMKDALRARILKNMLLEVARKGKDQ